MLLLIHFNFLIYYYAPNRLIRCCIKFKKKLKNILLRKYNIKINLIMTYLSPYTNEDFFNNGYVKELNPIKVYDINGNEYCSFPKNSKIFRVGFSSSDTSGISVKQFFIGWCTILFTYDYYDGGDYKDGMICDESVIIEFAVNGQSNRHIFENEPIKITKILIGSDTYDVNYSAI